MNYKIIDSMDGIRIEEIVRLLKMTYWADKRPVGQIGTQLVSHIESLPEYQGLRGILITKNAHALYSRFGYEVPNDRVMVKWLNC